MSDILAMEARHLVKAVIGIDPGCSGGATILTQDGRVDSVLSFHGGWSHMEFNVALCKILGRLAGLNSGVPYAAHNSVALEKVGTMPTDGRVGANTFGRVDGIIIGTVLTLDFRINHVPPMLWQSSLRCLTGGDKNVTKRKAQAIWPGTKWTHNTADSALIAEWLRRRNLNGA